MKNTRVDKYPCAACGSYKYTQRFNRNCVDCGYQRPRVPNTPPKPIQNSYSVTEVK